MDVVGGGKRLLTGNVDLVVLIFLEVFLVFQSVAILQPNASVRQDARTNAGTRTLCLGV